MENVMDEKTNDELPEEVIEFLVRYAAYRFFIKLIEMRYGLNGNSSGRSNESDDES